jgi:hypothetical protein
VLVDGARALPAPDAAEVLVERQGEEQAVDLGVRAGAEECAAQVVELRGRAPEVIDDEVDGTRIAGGARRATRSSRAGTRPRRRAAGWRR